MVRRRPVGQALEEAATSTTTPLLDRATQGQYALGSTFKVVDSIAGLENGVITPSTIYDCPGSYTPPHTLDKSVWHCWIYPGAHGPLDLTQAIVQSCDVYFYNVGYDFYSRKGEGLEDWAKRLGMGHPTGIDLPGEVAGLVPTPEWKNRPTPRRPTRRTGASTASGSPATRSTWPSARATSRRRRCRPR